jgi:xylan 1,4-beta-xylosidase
MTSRAPVPWRPIIAGFHPDPSICRVGTDYYLACSSFEYFPGVPIWHSTDLQTWELLGNALDRPDQLPLTGVVDSQGVYAPTLRHHDGLFWLITTVVGVPGHCIFTAEHAAGPWSDPVVVDLVGIDPDLAWDDDGTCYLTWADNHSDDDLIGIKQVRVDPRTGAVLSAARQPWSGTGLQYPEGPHLYHVDDWWYLLIAEGGTHAGHAVSVSRSRSPEGPFEGAPTNPIQSHRSLGHPVQNTGHGDLVRTPEGRWAMVMLGVRRLGGFPFYHLLGRETFLADVTWRDGWPVVDLVSGTAGDAVTWRDEFDGGALAPAWVSVRERPRGSWSLTDQPGRLTLSASTGSGADTFLGHRQQHLSCTVRVKVHADDLTYGGLRLRMSDHHHYDVEVAGGGVHARATIGPLTQTLDSLPLPAGDVVLRITTVRNSAPSSVAQHPDLVSLGVEIGDDYTELATLDGRYLSTEVAGGFTGRVVGPYVAAGRLLVDWVEYVGSDR